MIMAKKRNIYDNGPNSTLLRGGQVFFHNTRMYWQIISKLFVLCVFTTLVVALIWTLWSSDYPAGRSYGSQLMAQAQLKRQPDTERPMNVIMPDGRVEIMTPREVLNNAEIETGTLRFSDVLHVDYWTGSFIGLCAFNWIFSRLNGSNVIWQRAVPSNPSHRTEAGESLYPTSAPTLIAMAPVPPVAVLLTLERTDPHHV